MTVAGVGEDGCPRPDTTLEGLAALEPAFVRDGTVTAGTSSPLTDGAAAVLVTSERFAREHGLEPLARGALVRRLGLRPGGDGHRPGAGHAQGARAGRDRRRRPRRGRAERGLRLAGASPACASSAIDPARCNIDGGAIALGHPLGATGARITGKAAQLLRREGGRYALATQCIGGGQGIATVLEAVV